VGPGAAIGAIGPPKTCESNFFTIILHNSENIIRDVEPSCRPLFCTAVFLSILYLSYRSETVVRLDYQILLKWPPLNLLAGSALGCKYCTVYKLQDRIEYGLIETSMISSASYFNLGGRSFLCGLSGDGTEFWAPVTAWSPQLGGIECG